MCDCSTAHLYHRRQGLLAYDTGSFWATRRGLGIARVDVVAAIDASYAHVDWPIGDDEPYIRFPDGWPARWRDECIGFYTETFATRQAMASAVLRAARVARIAPGGRIRLPDELPNCIELHCPHCTEIVTLPALPRCVELYCPGCTGLTALPPLPRARYVYAPGCQFDARPRLPKACRLAA